MAAGRPRPRPRPPATSPPAPARCRTRGATATAREIAAIVNRAGDQPLAAVEQVAEAAYAEKSGFLLANCHGIMHTVGRECAIRHPPDAGAPDGLPAATRTTPAARPATATASSPRIAPQIEQPAPRRRPTRRAGRRTRATSATAASTASATPSCGSTWRCCRRRWPCASSSARRRARLRAGRLSRLLVLGLRLRRRRRSRAPRRHRPAQAVRRAAGEVRASLLVPRVPGEPAAASACSRRRSWSSCAAGLKGIQRRAASPAPRDRPARPARPALDLRSPAGRRPARLRARHQGPEHPQLSGRALGRARRRPAAG